MEGVAVGKGAGSIYWWQIVFTTSVAGCRSELRWTIRIEKPDRAEDAHRRPAGCRAPLTAKPPATPAARLFRAFGSKRTTRRQFKFVSLDALPAVAILHANPPARSPVAGQKCPSAKRS